MFFFVFVLLVLWESVVDTECFLVVFWLMCVLCACVVFSDRLLLLFDCFCLRVDCVGVFASCCSCVFALRLPCVYLLLTVFSFLLLLSACCLLASWLHVVRFVVVCCLPFACCVVSA